MKENPLSAIMSVQTNPPGEGNEQQHGPKLTGAPLGQAQFSHQLTTNILHLLSAIVRDVPLIRPRRPIVKNKKTEKKRLHSNNKYIT